MDRAYSYVGDAELNDAELNDAELNDAELNDAELFRTERIPVASNADIYTWLQKTQSHKCKGLLIFTFVVDTEGLLWIAARQSEHVACARGANVLSAGEITFGIADGQVFVSAITNQSTGYCPELESWSAVASALEKAHLAHPNGFTQAFIFRLCKKCGQRNHRQRK